MLSSDDEQSATNSNLGVLGKAHVIADGIVWYEKEPQETCHICKENNGLKTCDNELIESVCCSQTDCFDGCGKLACR